MTPFSIALDARDAAGSAVLRTVVGSLPAHFCVADGRNADVVVVSASQADWTHRLRSAIEAHVPGVLLTSPGPAEDDDLRDIAASDTVVGVDIGFAADRSWQEALPAIREDVHSAVLLDSLITLAGASPATAAVAQLAMVRPIVGAFDRLDLVHRSDTQYVIVGSAGGLSISLTGLLSALSFDSLRLDLVGPRQRWRACLNGDAVARPSEITRFDRDGATARLPLYESPHRAMLLALHGALTNGSPLAYGLAELVEDVATLALLGLTARPALR